MLLPRRLRRSRPHPELLFARPLLEVLICAGRRTNRNGLCGVHSQYGEEPQRTELPVRLGLLYEYVRRVCKVHHGGLPQLLKRR